jgi:hypothetical protein
MGVVDPPPGMQTRADVHYSIHLGADGEAWLTQRRLYYGHAVGPFHRRFAEMPPEERRRFFRELVAEISQSAEAQGNLLTQYGTYPAERAFSVRSPRYAVRDGRFLYVTLPRARDGLGLRADRREQPLFRPAPLRARTVYRVTLPRGDWHVERAPQALTWKAPAGMGRVIVGVDRRRDGLGRHVIEIARTLDLQPAVVPAADYPALLEMQRRLDHPDSRTLLVRLPE